MSLKAPNTLLGISDPFFSVWYLTVAIINIARITGEKNFHICIYISASCFIVVLLWLESYYFHHSLISVVNTKDKCYGYIYFPWVADASHKKGWQIRHEISWWTRRSNKCNRHISHKCPQKVMMTNSPQNFVTNAKEQWMWWIYFLRVAEMTSWTLLTKLWNDLDKQGDFTFSKWLHTHSVATAISWHFFKTDVVNSFFDGSSINCGLI